MDPKVCFGAVGCFAAAARSAAEGPPKELLPAICLPKMFVEVVVGGVGSLAATCEKGSCTGLGSCFIGAVPSNFDA